MERVMPREKLRVMLDQVTREITRQEAGICLTPADPEKNGPIRDPCTVYIAFERGMDGTLCLCANRAMFARFARDVMETDEPTPRDVADVAKEYLNVLAGHVLSRLFPEARRPARFKVPAFCRGPYAPEGERLSIALDYASDQEEQVRFSYYSPHGDENTWKKDVSV